MSWIFIIPLIPAAAFVALVALPRRARNAARFVALAAIALAFLASAAALIHLLPGHEMGEPLARFSWTLATVGSRALTITLGADSLGILMLAMVSLVGTCVQVYSLFYMKDDERRGWFFCVMSLFLSAMLTFVLSANLLLQFAMWEIMGVCSYLLIGFWYTDEAPRKASQKAFLVTRTGDVGFFVGLAAIFAACDSFEFEHIYATAAQWSPFLLMVASLGLVWAAMGKSAQFPLSAWLPDAMAGPTPGSALIHAATMVVAGVLMLIRMLPMLALNPLALQLILAVGIITGLYGGVLACFQTDLKKVLAFSTISQLGLMFAAIGVNAAGAAVFHLTTHAFFKALLFMTAGIIIHSTHTQDMREMGGLARSMPITTIVFSIGSFALAGMVPLSGFFSKDEIFTVILHSGNYLAFAGALLVGLLTALYVVKTWFRVFFGSTNDHASHEGGPLELVPVSVLALLTLALGFVTPHFARLLGHEGEWPTLAMASISTAVLLVGGFIGYFLFSHRDVTDRLTRYFSLVSIAAQRRFYLDWFYEVAVIRPYFWLSHALWTLDTRVIDAAVGGVVALYRLLTRVTDILDTRVIDAVVNAVATVYKAATTLAAAVDTHVIDGAVNTVAFGYRALTQGARRVDQGLIDGAVNGLGVLAQELGKRFRALQNGHIQRYQRLIVGVAVALVLMVVIVFQVFAMKGA